VMEVMSGMMGSEVPLAVMPGGTGNVLATDLGIPKDLEEVCTMLAKGHFKLQPVDVGRFNRTYFIVRASLGFEANMVKHADREVKNRWGKFAYTIGAFKALQKVKLVNYEVTVDDEKHEVMGMSCLVANSGNTGYGDLQLAKKMDVSDGLLDVLILKKFNFSLLTYITRILMRGDPEKNRELVAHWQGRDIRVKASPAQDLTVDGEVVKKMDFHTKVIPAAVKILVPRAEKS
jgi:diacylglycerol kinase (ATP)